MIESKFAGQPPSAKAVEDVPSLRFEGEQSISFDRSTNRIRKSTLSGTVKLLGKKDVNVKLHCQALTAAQIEYFLPASESDSMDDFVPRETFKEDGRINGLYPLRPLGDEEKELVVNLIQSNDSKVQHKRLG